MRLASHEDIIAVGGMFDRGDASTTFNANLEQVTTELENEIGTSLRRADTIDYFGCLDVINGDSLEPEFRLLTTNSVIDPEETVRVYYSTDGTVLSNVTGTNVAELDQSLWSINRKMGVLSVNSALVKFTKRRCIAVRYISGFVEESGVAVIPPVYEALKHAAMTKAVRSARGFSITAPKTNTRERRDEMARIAKSQMASFIRPRVLGNTPQFVEDKT